MPTTAGESVVIGFSAGALFVTFTSQPQFDFGHA